MRDKAFDQLPVSSANGTRLVGLVTLGNLLSYISSGRAKLSTPVEEVMFDFQHLEKIVTDPAEAFSKSSNSLEREDHGALSAGADEVDRRRKEQHHSSRRPFVEITVDTPLSALSRFFERNSAAVVTEREEAGGLKAVAVVTKVDLLTWLVKQSKEHNDVG